MNELLKRNVDIVDYYTKPFRQKDKGRFKIRLKYPFTIYQIFQDEKKTIKVNLKYNGQKKYPDLRCKPLKYIDFELNDNEKRNIIKFITENNLKELFKKYWYLREDTIVDFLKREFTLKENMNKFRVVKNIGKKNHYRILFLLELYEIKRDMIKRNETLMEYCKKNNLSFILLDDKKVKDIYLDKKSKNILFFYEESNLLIPEKDMNYVKKFNGDFLLMYIDEN